MIAALFCVQELSAQDMHFSQFTQSPFNLNPGLTGQFDGQWRFIGNQRKQWRSVTVPYSTLGLSADTRITKARLKKLLPFLKSDDDPCKNRFSGWNVGLSFYTDKAGDSKLTTTLLQLAVSKEWDVHHDGSLLVVPGLMFGMTNMQIDYSALQYDNQWNGFAYQSSLNSGESFAREGRTYMHLHGGVAVVKKVNKTNHWSAGIGWYNISSPKQSWFDQSFVRLDRRVNFHARYTFLLKEKYLIEPALLYMHQGKYQELILGGVVHYILSNKQWMYRTVYAGVFGRAKDAGYVVAGMRYDDWNVGLSYDINTSNLKPASNSKGGLELSVTYIIPPNPFICVKKKVCPDYQ